MAARFAVDGWSQGLINLKTKKWNGKVRLAPHKLHEPLSWRDPSTVFVNSMTDMFHPGYTNEEIAAVFGVMAAAPQHTFQVLTKRAQRMREWFEWLDEQIESTAADMSGADCTLSIHTARDWSRLNFVLDAAREQLSDRAVESLERVARDEVLAWPLPNVWLGVSVEDQENADKRIPDLVRAPAAIRFLSCEPLLGPIDLKRWLDVPHEGSHLDWVISGCESGHGARGCDPAWLRSLRDQCVAAGVPYFLKQARPWDEGHERVVAMGIGRGPGSDGPDRGVLQSPYLDGKQWLQFPEARQ
jgi:protein gp37